MSIFLSLPAVDTEAKLACLWPLRTGLYPTSIMERNWPNICRYYVAAAAFQVVRQILVNGSPTKINAKSVRPSFSPLWSEAHI